mmetsp:Transcript_55407/g.121182  ORF Transcript_55407/g.121182 Transcript_55407/m.121182 type:complete len:508 (-) Transcript_55407:107-1630(-)
MSWRSFKDAVTSSLGYTTPLFIELTDLRLGILYYVIILSIILYACFYNIIILHGHMNIENPVGIVSVTFRLPSKDECQEFAPDCQLDLWPGEALPYCLAAYKDKVPRNTAAKSIATCIPMDSLDAVENQDTSILLGTYMEWFTQVRKCDPMHAVGEMVYADYNKTGLQPATLSSLSGAGEATLEWYHGHTEDKIHPVEELTFSTDYHCSRVWATETGPAKYHPLRVQDLHRTIRPTQVFIPNAERFMFVIDHSMSAPGLGISSNFKNLFGYIYSHNEEQCRTHPRRSTTKAERLEDVVPSTSAPCYIRSKLVKFTTDADVFDVSDLLEAAGIDLDHPHGASYVDGSFRRHGVFLVMNIWYSNLQPYKMFAKDITYHYEVYALRESRGETERSYYVNYPTSRVVEQIQGIKILINQDGAIGAFSWTRLLINFASGLTMLAVATFVVDNIGMYCLPERHVFAHLKYPNRHLDEDEKEILTAELATMMQEDPTAAKAAASELRMLGVNRA